MATKQATIEEQNEEERQEDERDFKEFMDKWGLEYHPLPYNEISTDDIEYLLCGHYTR